VVGIQTCAQYLQRISNGLRLLAADPVGARTNEVTELGAWWTDAEMMLKNVLPRGIRFEHKLPSSECWVKIGRAALTQAVFNLLQNAVDCLRERGNGWVAIIAEDDPSTAEIKVHVSDDGPGMTEELKRRCLEPYFTTKTRAFSTGMGLPFVTGLLTGAGGRVVINSTMGRGTTVSLVLPRAARQAKTADSSRPIAVVNLKDVRMRSFIRGEFRALGFDVRSNVASGRQPSVIVTEPGALEKVVNGGSTERSRLIVIGDSESVEALPFAEVIALGPKPDPDAICRALRSAAEKTHATLAR
jgi:anti-sigma regulatory factor (Ser/Thr protein kinase)